jgi:uncharacterized protein YcbX
VAAGQVVGSVTGLWRFPVKSMRGGRVEPVSTSMSAFAQDELPKDTEILRALAQRNRIQVGAAGEYPCAGVYAVVEATGSVRTGDPVALA